MGNINSLDIIIAFLKARKKGKKDNEQIVECEYNGFKYDVYSGGYLLNQVIRELYIPPEHYKVSKRAKMLWDELTSDDINKYFVGSVITCDKVKDDKPIKVKFFKGNSNTPYEIKSVKRNEKLLYNRIFHNEHIVTINDIVNELLKLESPNYNNVAEILNKIYICRILKVENKYIKHQKHRCSLNFVDIIKNEYFSDNETSIEVIDIE